MDSEPSFLLTTEATIVSCPHVDPRTKRQPHVKPLLLVYRPHIQDDTKALHSIQLLAAAAFVTTSPLCILLSFLPSEKEKRLLRFWITSTRPPYLGRIYQYLAQSCKCCAAVFIAPFYCSCCNFRGLLLYKEGGGSSSDKMPNTRALLELFTTSVFAHVSVHVSVCGHMGPWKAARASSGPNNNPVNHPLQFLTPPRLRSARGDFPPVSKHR